MMNAALNKARPHPFTQLLSNTTTQSDDLPIAQTTPTTLGPSTPPLPKEPGLPSSSSTPRVHVPTQQQLDSGIQPDPDNIWGSAAPAAQEPEEHHQFPQAPPEIAGPPVSLQEANATELMKLNWKAVNRTSNKNTKCGK